MSHTHQLIEIATELAMDAKDNAADLQRSVRVEARDKMPGLVVVGRLQSEREGSDSRIQRTRSVQCQSRAAAR